MKWTRPDEQRPPAKLKYPLTSTILRYNAAKHGICPDCSGSLIIDNTIGDLNHLLCAQPECGFKGAKGTGIFHLDYLGLKRTTGGLRHYIRPYFREDFEAGELDGFLGKCGDPV